jgi:hypothetical protein
MQLSFVPALLASGQLVEKAGRSAANVIEFRSHNVMKPRINDRLAARADP